MGISPLPGGSGLLETDLRTIGEWGPDLIVSLTEQSEMDAACVGHLGRVLADLNIAWEHMPIVDFGIPDTGADKQWAELRKRVRSILDARGRVLVHCKGGRGRSGMIVLRVMIERGEDPGDALDRVRSARPGTVETDEQHAWAARATASTRI